MLTIGLTGGIGSGKSTVAKLFEQLHVPIIDADVIAHQITRPDGAAFNDIVEHFKNDSVLLPTDHLDRPKLRKIIFENIHERVWLENLLHPIILEEIKTKLSTLSSPYCIIVIPLLIEKGPLDFIDRILVVDAPIELQLKRITQRDNSPAGVINQILQTQISREDRLKHADDIIDNSQEESALLSQVQELHQFYLLESRRFK